MNSNTQLSPFDDAAENVTALQFSVKKRHGGGGPKTSENRKRFLRAYEQTFGNVSASCEFSGISRRTYYRWMKSSTPINRRFRSQLENIKPKEKFLDFLEGKLVERIREGDIAAIIYALKTKARNRGYNERSPIEVVEDVPPRNEETAAAILNAISRRAQDKGITYADEIQYYLRRFGDRLREDIRILIERESQKESPNG